MNPNPHLHLIFPILLLTLLSSCNAAYSSGKVIYDLMSNSDPYSLDSEASSWTVSNEVCNGCTRCISLSTFCYQQPDQMIFGGPGILGPAGSTNGQYFEWYYPLGSNTLDNLGFSFEFWVIGKTPFNVNDIVDFTVNGNDLGWTSPTYYSGCLANYTTNSGGSFTNALFSTPSVQHMFPFNSASSITFRITSKLNVSSISTSFGIRRLYVYLLDTPKNGTVNFPCDTLYFWDGTNCSLCHNFCSSCTGISNTQCSACVYPNFYYQNNTCGNFCPTTGPLSNSSSSSLTSNYCTFKCGTGFYWSYNDSCASTCNTPLVQTEGDQSNNYVDTCASPCPFQYFYPNGSCVSTCAGIFEPVIEKINVIQYCQNPCGLSTYMYPNGSCHSTCPPPLLTRGEPGVIFCYTPCAANEHLYSNGSCSIDCNFPLSAVTENNLLYCKNPCSSSAFLYPDGTCNSTCASPLLNRTEPGVSYCFTPCGTNTFLYSNGSCLSTCSLPLISTEEPNKNFRFCTNPCDPLGAMPYLNPDSSCNSTCALPLLSRSEPGVKYCWTPCLGSQYLYANGSCFPTCPIPLISREGPSTFRFCINPCGTSPLFLYPDSSCNSTCVSPLLSRSEPGVKYCFTPCNGTQYLYTNGTCSERCETPLLKKEELTKNFKFCNNPCGPDLFIFPDSSCNQTCASPLFERIEPNVSYCYNPCAWTGTFLYETQVCQATCPYPNTIQNVAYAKYCNFPCRNYDDYFNMVDKKCEATCPYPYVATESPLPKLCSSSLSEEERKQVEQMAGATSAVNSAAETGNLIWSLISSGDSTAACMGPLAKMLQYIKFMDIVFPEKVQLMLLEQTKKANKRGFTSKMMGSALDKFPNHELTGKFIVYPINSSFFVNFWPSFFNLSVILLVTGLVIFALAFTKGNPKIQGILKSLSEVLKWNVFLVTFCGTIGDIILYTALQFQAMQFENTEEIVSFIVCLGINALAVVVVVKILDVNSAIRRAKKDNLGEEQQKMIEKEWSSYKALFECYKDYSFYQQIFLFVFIMRLVLFNASIGYLYKFPLLQATISMVSNLLMLLYLVIKRPMRKIITLIQQIVLELVLLPFNTCVLALAIMDDQEILEIDRRKAIGNIIFYINVMVPILSVVLMAAKFIAMAVDMYKTWRLSKSQKPKGLAIEDGRRKTHAKLRNQPMSLESSQNKSFTTTDNNNYNTSQILDMNDNSMMMMMSPEINMMRSNSRVADSPIIHPRIRHSRPQMQINNVNFSILNNQNMVQSSSGHQRTFPQQQSQVPGEFRVQHVSRTPSDLELSNIENIDQSIHRRKSRIKKSGRSRLQQDDELIW